MLDPEIISSYLKLSPQDREKLLQELGSTAANRIELTMACAAVIEISMSLSSVIISMGGHSEASKAELHQVVDRIRDLSQIMVRQSGLPAKEMNERISKAIQTIQAEADA